jgi:hypothetical protein
MSQTIAGLTRSVFALLEIEIDHDVMPVGNVFPGSEQRVQSPNKPEYQIPNTCDSPYSAFDTRQ